jgi:FtsP/CotA-like multicopper oxidase with cupredoxin domain
VSDVLAFNGTVPGPVLRVTEGDTVQITVVNKLQEPTSIHWHGLHVPNAMDGVPGLNQQPIAPGGSFAYKFIAPHAGTFMYHPHGPGVNDIAQIDQGLYGLFIINPWQPVGPAYARDYAFIILVAWCCRTA